MRSSVLPTFSSVSIVWQRFLFFFTLKALSRFLVELKGWLMALFCFRRDWSLGRSLEQERAETCIFDHLRKPVGHRMMSHFSWVLKQKRWLSQQVEKFKYGNSDKLRTGSLLGMVPERSPRIKASWKHNKQNVAYASKNPEIYTRVPIFLDYWQSLHSKNMSPDD